MENILEDSDPTVSKLIVAILPFSEARKNARLMGDSGEIINIPPVSSEILAKCFERLTISVKRWTNKKKNSRVYLDFITKFIR